MNSKDQRKMLSALVSCQVSKIIVVPSSGLSDIYAYFENKDGCIYVTREEEGIALAAGLTLNGTNCVVLVQQSGVGNALNAVFTLADAYSIAFSIGLTYILYRLSLT